MKRASPGSSPTRLRRNCSRVIAVSADTTAAARSSSCWIASRSVSSTRVGSRTSSGRVASCSSIAWRSVLDGIVPGMDRHAAEAVAPLGDGDALAELGGLDGGSLAARSRADDE